MSAIDWKTAKEYSEITFQTCQGVARIAFNRPEVRNAFTPKTVDELWEALILCHESQDIGVVIITAKDLQPKTAVGPSVRAAISAFAPIPATKAKTGSTASTSWTCSDKFVS